MSQIPAYNPSHQFTYSRPQSSPDRYLRQVDSRYRGSQAEDCGSVRDREENGTRAHEAQAKYGYTSVRGIPLQEEASQLIVIGVDEETRNDDEEDDERELQCASQRFSGGRESDEVFKH